MQRDGGPEWRASSDAEWRTAVDSSIRIDHHAVRINGIVTRVSSAAIESNLIDTQQRSDPAERRTDQQQRRRTAADQRSAANGGECNSMAVQRHQCTSHDAQCREE